MRAECGPTGRGSDDNVTRPAHAPLVPLVDGARGAGNAPDEFDVDDPARLASLNRQHARRTHINMGLDLGPPDGHAQPEMLGRGVIRLCRDANLSVEGHVITGSRGGAND